MLADRQPPKQLDVAMRIARGRWVMEVVAAVLQDAATSSSRLVRR